MLNYETLLSNYDDKLTLMQWLKKVEAALKDASATAFVVNKKGNATISFEIDFEDGTKLESGDIILQQGESVTGATIVGGHLILTLSNGDTLDAGDLGGVTSFSIDGTQHLIVHYQNGTTQDLGAIFDGASIKVNALTSDNAEIQAQKPVVEVMTGYSFSPHVDLAANGVVLNYAGVVKNGNKLTMAIAGVFTPTTGVPSTSNFILGVFTIPQDVADKLVLNSLLALDNRSIAFFDGTTSSVSKYGRVSKNAGDNVIRFSLYGMGSTFALDTPYEFRYEVTFLLSPNLAA